MSKLIKKLMILVPAAMLLGMLSTPGCATGDACVKGCEDAAECAGTDASGCQETCDNARQAAVDLGCESQYDDQLNNCSVSGQVDCDNPGEPSGDCVEAAAAFVECSIMAATP